MRGTLVRAVLIALVVAGTWAAVDHLEQRQAAQRAAMGAQAPPPAAVSVATVSGEDWSQALFAVGSLAADQGVDVTAPLPGTVIDIAFESGQHVRRGQVLLSMDVGIQQAERSGLQAALELREVQYTRARKLLADRQISQSDYDAARAARDEGGALQAQQAHRSQASLRAPTACSASG